MYFPILCNANTISEPFENCVFCVFFQMGWMAKFSTNDLQSRFIPVHVHVVMHRNFNLQY